MRAIIIGGAGKQGSGAASVLARRESITELVLADIDLQRLREVAENLACTVKTVQLDANDESAVADLLAAESDAAVLLNAIGPGFRFAEPIMRAAIAAGLNYVDIQDDAEVVDQVAAMDSQASAAGLTMVSGAGLTPGLSNVLCRHAYDNFDRLEEVKIFWVSNMTETPTVANWGHRLGAWSADVPLIENGELVTEPGASREQVIEWPAPAGPVVQRLCAHPEPLSLIHTLPGIRQASVWGGYTPAQHDLLLAELRDLGLTSFEPTEIPGIGEIVPIRFMSGFAASDTFRRHPRFQQVLAEERKIGDHNGLRVEATGLRDGATAVHTYTFFSPDRNIGIYTTAAVTTYLVAEGAIEHHGVRFAEQLEPEIVIDQVRGQGIEINESTEVIMKERDV